MSGIFDWWRKKKPSESKEIIYIGPEGEAHRGLQAAPGPKATIPYRPQETLKDKLLSAFSILDPKEKPKSLQVFDIFQEAPKELVQKSSEKEQQEFLDAMFGEVQEVQEEEGELFDLFEPSPLSEASTDVFMPPSETDEPREISTEHAGPESADWVTGEPPIYWHTQWRLPTPFGMVHWVQNNPDKVDLNGIFEYTIQSTDYPDWRRMAAEASHTGEPAILEIQQVADHRTVYQDLANFFDIPDVVLDAYFLDLPSKSAMLEMSRLFKIEVVDPITERFSLALDALRPPYLRGWYELSPSHDLDWWLKYKEAKYN
jgi:hypothetical protein